MFIDKNLSEIFETKYHIFARTVILWALFRKCCISNWFEKFEYHVVWLLIQKVDDLKLPHLVN